MVYAGTHACHDVHMEVRGQLCRLILGLRLELPGFHGKFSLLNEPSRQPILKIERIKKY